MPRIYKPVGPSTNKAVNPVKETKTAHPPKEVKPQKEEKPQKADETNDGGQ